MRLFSSQKTWFFIALFFIIVNIILIAGFFMRRHRYHEMKTYHGQHGRERMHGRRSMLHTDFIADSLNFSEEQKKEMKKMEEELDTRKDSVYLMSESCKRNFSRELFSDNPDRAKLDSLTVCISRSTELYNKIRIEKIFRIRALCNPEQLKKFNSILSRLAAKHYHGGQHLR